MGGSTGHWSGWNAPFTPLDFEKREWIPHSGWPIDFDELRQYYEAAQNYMALGQDGYGRDSWDDEYGNLPNLNSENLDCRLWQFSSPPINYGVAFRDALESSQNIIVYLNASAIGIDLHKSGSSVDNVIPRSLNGKVGHATAKHYVLACGGIENPRLLLASKSVSSTGVGNDRDLVGRFFTEHLQVECATLAQFDVKQMQDIKRKTSRIGTQIGTVFTPSATQQKIQRIANGGMFISTPSLNTSQDGWKSFMYIRNALTDRSITNSYILIALTAIILLPLASAARYIIDVPKLFYVVLFARYSVALGTFLQIYTMCTVTLVLFKKPDNKHKHAFLACICVATAVSVGFYAYGWTNSVSIGLKQLYGMQ